MIPSVTFRDAARRANWLDGVEIVASHGYLRRNFESENGHLRDDGYGGNVDEDRLRFLRE